MVNPRAIKIGTPSKEVVSDALFKRLMALLWPGSVSQVDRPTAKDTLEKEFVKDKKWILDYFRN